MTVFIGRIPRTARFKELKEALAERGVKVSGSGGNYSNTLVWKGNKGFAFLNCDERTHSLEDLAKQLDGLKLGDTELNIKTDQRKQRKVSEITEAEKGAVVVPPDSADESKGSDGQSGGGSDSKVKAAKKSERQKKGDGSNQKKKSEDKEAAGNDAAQKEVKDSVPAKNTTTGDKESAPVPESADASKGSNSSSTSGENKKEPIVPKKEDDGSNHKKKGEDKEATDNAAPQKERVDSVPAKKETEAQSGEAAPPVEKENS